MSKYNVGDKVRVRKDLEVGRRYNKQIVVSDMLTYQGGVYEIINQGVSGGYQLNNCNGYWFSDDMLEPYLKKKAKEVQEEYTFQEVIQRIKEGETYVSTDINYRLDSIKCINGDIRFAGEFSSVFRTDEYQKFKFQETKKNYYICQVEHTKGGKLYNFRCSTQLFSKFVVCDTKYGKSYGRVISKKLVKLTEKEYLEYKECFPV